VILHSCELKLRTAGIHLSENTPPASEGTPVPPNARAMSESAVVVEVLPVRIEAVNGRLEAGL